MFDWDKFEEIYKWVSNSCPRFVDWVLVIATFCLGVSVIYFIGWLATTVLGWHLLTVLIVLLFVVTATWAFFTHSHLPGGMKQWWGERPWKK